MISCLSFYDVKIGAFLYASLFQRCGDSPCWLLYISFMLRYRLIYMSMNVFTCCMLYSGILAPIESIKHIKRAASDRTLKRWFRHKNLFFLFHVKDRNFFICLCFCFAVVVRFLSPSLFLSITSLLFALRLYARVSLVNECGPCNCTVRSTFQ